MRTRCLIGRLKGPLFFLLGVTFLLYFAVSVTRVFHRDDGDLKSTSGSPSNPFKNLPQVKTDIGNLSAVIDMTRFAWRGYIHLCALQQTGNELAPVTNSCSSLNDPIFGPNNLITVIDSLDTLALMGLTKEFKQGRELTEKMFDPMLKNSHVSVFETTIRILGGLLGAFSFTEDSMFIRLAAQVADGLSSALESGRFPTHVKMKSKEGDQGSQEKEFTKSATSAADFGSLYLEFAYLAELLNDQRLLSIVEGYKKALMSLDTLDGLVPMFLVVESPWKLKGAASIAYSIGAMSDSYYEYLVKRCLYDSPVKSDCIRVFTRALNGIVKHLTVTTSNNNLCVIGWKPDDGKPSECHMEHLSCFAGGMFALGYLQNRSRTDWLEYAERITQTCYLSYLHSPTGLGPETFAFDKSTQKFLGTNDKYILRPETVESLYYLYRVTGKQVYRDWGWNIIKALNSRTRTASGFSGLLKMNSDATYDNTQWSFFLAETLKYLYLLFASSDTLPMDQWVFNTEAHVFPSNRNPFRWKQSQKKDTGGLLLRFFHSARFY